MRKLGRNASEASVGLSRSITRAKDSVISNKDKDRSKAPSITGKSDVSDPLDFPIGKEIKHPITDFNNQ